MRKRKVAMPTKSVKILKAKRIEDKERLRAWHERIALMAHSDTDIEASPL